MISNWEVMETIKKKIIPAVFLSLKVCISSLTKVLLEAEVACIKDQASIIKKIDGNSIKLSGFQDKFNVLAEPAKIKILKKYDWEVFFKDNVDYDLHERPDTVYLDDLPTSWFKSDSKTIEENVIQTFSKFGDISATAFPGLDIYEERVNNIIETGCDIHHGQGFKKTSFAARVLMSHGFFNVYFFFKWNEDGPISGGRDGTPLL
ncbi:hypothetical protein MXB_5493 [Myxobolus squamalis]|nr:hypothetical protein MXB_5493 [Myxobolus squamalis]